MTRAERKIAIINDYCDRNYIQSHYIREDGSVDLVMKKDVAYIDGEAQPHYYLRHMMLTVVNEFAINNIDTEMLTYANLQSTSLRNLPRCFTGKNLVIEHCYTLYDITNFPRFTDKDAFTHHIEIKNCPMLDDFNSIQKDFCGNLKFSSTSIKNLLTLPYAATRLTLYKCDRFEDFTDIELFNNLEEVQIFYGEYNRNKPFKNILNIFENKSLALFTVNSYDGLTYSNSVIKIAQDFINAHTSCKLDYVMDFVVMAHEYGFEIT